MKLTADFCAVLTDTEARIVKENVEQAVALAVSAPTLCSNCKIPLVNPSQDSQVTGMCDVCTYMQAAVQIRPGLVEAHREWLKEKVRAEKIIHPGEQP